MAYDPICSNCSSKSANCAYGNLRGSQSCEDNRKPIPMSYLRINAANLDRHNKAKILKRVLLLGFTFVNEDKEEDIHTINRRIQMPVYLENGNQNMKIHDWNKLHALNLEVEYAGSNGLLKLKKS